MRDKDFRQSCCGTEIPIYVLALANALTDYRPRLGEIRLAVIAAGNGTVDCADSGCFSTVTVALLIHFATFTLVPLSENNSPRIRFSHLPSLEDRPVSSTPSAVAGHRRQDRPIRFSSLPALGLRRVPHRRAFPTVAPDPRSVARAAFTWHVKRPGCRANGVSGGDSFEGTQIQPAY